MFRMRGRNELLGARSQAAGRAPQASGGRQKGKDIGNGIQCNITCWLLVQELFAAGFWSKNFSPAQMPKSNAVNKQKDMFRMRGRNELIGHSVLQICWILLIGFGFSAPS